MLKLQRLLSLQHHWGFRFPMVPLHFKVHLGKGCPGQPRIVVLCFSNSVLATQSRSALPVQCTAVAASVLMGQLPSQFASVLQRCFQGRG